MTNENTELSDYLLDYIHVCSKVSNINTCYLHLNRNLDNHNESRLWSIIVDLLEKSITHDHQLDINVHLILSQQSKEAWINPSFPITLLDCYPYTSKILLDRIQISWYNDILKDIGEFINSISLNICDYNEHANRWNLILVELTPTNLLENCDTFTTVLISSKMISSCIEIKEKNVIFLYFRVSNNQHENNALLMHYFSVTKTGSHWTLFHSR